MKSFFEMLVAQQTPEMRPADINGNGNETGMMAPAVNGQKLLLSPEKCSEFLDVQGFAVEHNLCECYFFFCLFVWFGLVEFLAGFLVVEGAKGEDKVGRQLEAGRKERKKERKIGGEGRPGKKKKGKKKKK